MDEDNEVDSGRLTPRDGEDHAGSVEVVSEEPAAMRLLFFILFAGLLAPVAFAEEKLPNVLFIAVDDLNDWVGHLGGHPQAKTPNIDRLASKGVSFTRAYCSAPLCNPSRVSLLTGILPSNSGVYGNGESLRKKMPDAITLMQYLNSNN